MKRALELFTFEERPSSSPFVTTLWSTRSVRVPAESFISGATTQWELVVTRQDAGAWVTLRGPETKASPAPIPADAEFFGIHFGLGTFMPSLPPGRLLDGSVTLPLASPTSFWLAGSAWELPGPDDADVFVDRLVRAGLLVHDPVVPAALQDDTRGLSVRSVERRVARATGLTRGMIRQIERADRAVELLGRGLAPLDVADLAGYADQAHLTRSLTRFVGQTPARIVPPTA